MLSACCRTCCTNAPACAVDACLLHLPLLLRPTCTHLPTCAVAARRTLVHMRTAPCVHVHCTEHKHAHATKGCHAWNR